VNSLRAIFGRQAGLGRWLRIAAALVILGTVLVPIASSSAKSPCTPSLTCERHQDRDCHLDRSRWPWRWECTGFSIHWTASGLANGYYKVEMTSLCGNKSSDFYVYSTKGCNWLTGSFALDCEEYTITLKYRAHKSDPWQSVGQCNGGEEPLPEPEEPPVCEETPIPPCIRADISAIIWGGWDGIVVNATVGGAQQQPMLTAHDAFGRPAVLWTFYPPEDDDWNVVVTPQLPASLDPKLWKYEPASATVTIGRCHGTQVFFRLIHTGPNP